MNENDGGYKKIVDDIRKKLRRTYLKAELDLDYLKHDLEYKSKVNAQEHQRAANNSQEFAEDGLSFFADNPSSVISPLHPTRDQLASLYQLLTATKDGTLSLYKVRGKIRNSGDPFLIHDYKLTNLSQNDQEQPNIASMQQRREVAYTIYWDVKGDFPIGFNIHGYKGFDHLGALRFLALDKKAESGDDLEKIFGKSTKKAIKKVTIYQEGKRITVSHEAETETEEFSLVTQYYLLGSLENPDTGKVYWIYGSNEDTQSKQTIKDKQRVGVFDTLKQAFSGNN